MFAVATSEDVVTANRPLSIRSRALQTTRSQQLYHASATHPSGGSDGCRLSLPCAPLASASKLQQDQACKGAMICRLVVTEVQACCMSTSLDCTFNKRMLPLRDEDSAEGDGLVVLTRGELRHTMPQQISRCNSFRIISMFDIWFHVFIFRHVFLL